MVSKPSMIEDTPQLGIVMNMARIQIVSYCSREECYAEINTMIRAYGIMTLTSFLRNVSLNAWSLTGREYSS